MPLEASRGVAFSNYINKIISVLYESNTTRLMLRLKKDNILSSNNNQWNINPLHHRQRLI